MSQIKLPQQNITHISNYSWQESTEFFREILENVIIKIRRIENLTSQLKVNYDVFFFHH